MTFPVSKLAYKIQNLKKYIRFSLFYLHEHNCHCKKLYFCVGYGYIGYLYMVITGEEWRQCWSVL